MARMPKLAISLNSVHLLPFTANHRFLKMSSFKRRSSSGSETVYPGTRILPGSAGTLITSTGIPSLDDILGGGLPLTNTALTLALDTHTAYGELVQKYFLSQGIACGHDVWIVDDNASVLLSESMWLPGTSSTSSQGENEEGNAEGEDVKIKIAWRYSRTKQFQTTIPSASQSESDFCKVFDLTSQIPQSIIDSTLISGQLKFFAVSGPDPKIKSTQQILEKISKQLEEPSIGTDAQRPVRICVPFLGSPQWGDLNSQDLCNFLYHLRRIVRKYPHACASISLPPHICEDSWGGTGWIQKLGWLCDACISLSAFTADPTLSALFPSHHGTLRIYSLPSPSSLYAPSDKFSVLRGLSSSGENNLAFKCMRKRLVFETLHLDVEGGVGERRTTPATAAMALDAETYPHEHESGEGLPPPSSAIPKVEIQLETTKETASVSKESQPGEHNAPKKKAKPKKRVAFNSERPDLYDF